VYCEKESLAIARGAIYHFVPAFVLKNGVDENGDIEERSGGES